MGFFQKHGMTNVVYFKPMDAPLSQTTLIYLLSHESRDAAARSWAAFRNDPDWKKVSSETRRHGLQGRIRVPGADRLLTDEIDAQTGRDHENQATRDWCGVRGRGGSRA